MCILALQPKKKEKKRVERLYDRSYINEPNCHHSPVLLPPVLLTLSHSCDTPSDSFHLLVKTNIFDY